MLEMYCAAGRRRSASSFIRCDSDSASSFVLISRRGHHRDLTEDLVRQRDGVRQPEQPERIPDAPLAVLVVDDDRLTVGARLVGCTRLDMHAVVSGDQPGWHSDAVRARVDKAVV
eukprot:scaffold65824_cov69-Phaeocystis_antarctica.AAC.6